MPASSPPRILVAVLLFFSILTGAAAAEKTEGRPKPPFRGAIAAAAVRPHVEYLASPELEGRGTVHGKNLAANYIRRQFVQLGLKPLFDEGSYFQTIPGPQKDASGKPIDGKNIGAWLSGSDPKLRDEFIIVSAHYDHLGIRANRIYPGADDNASGVAMLLEVATQLAKAKHRPRRSIAFLSFDLEERLLFGSRWFVAHPPWPLERVKFFMTADMIGRSLGDLPLQSIFVLGSEHAPAIRQIVADVGQPHGLQVAPLSVDLIGTRSDYGPFRAQRVPFLFFSSGEHPDYHSPRDTADRVDYDKVAAVSNLVLGIIRRVADVEETPQWIDEPEHTLDEVTTLHKITGLLLQPAGGGKPRVSALHRFFISNMHDRMEKILKRGELRSDERPWLIRMSQFLLLTVF